MLKKYTRTFVYVGLFTCLLGAVISCEKDFTDIGTEIVSNGDFSTSDSILEIEITSKSIDRVQTDGFDIGGVLGQYLLGVYNNSNYEKIEASIVSQLQIPFDLTLVDREYGTDTTVVTTIDTVFLTLPYQATATGSGDNGIEYELDSIIGNRVIPARLNVYRLTSFLNTLDPTDPASQNKYYSDDQYDLDLTTPLNVFQNAPFVPNKADTTQTVLRKLSDGTVYETEDIVFASQVPYLSIPLKKGLIKQLFFDQYESDNFASQDAFDNYFRGIKIQAEGADGAMVSFNFANQTTIRPAIQIYYTNTVLKSGTVIDTIKKTDSFLLSGVRTSTYKMTPGNTPQFNNVPLQGAAGSMAQVKILGDDNDGNGIPDGLEELRTKDWLVTDAELTFYVDQNIVRFDTIATPFRLFLYKDGLTSTNETNASLIMDYITEGEEVVGGNLSLDSDKRPDKYTFKITDYISELLSGDIDYLPTLGLKVFNPSDIPVTLSDTITKEYNWNPKAVMLLNHFSINGTRKAQLKISYSKKK
ncbi:MAG: DUF4270 domain-containing protein [Flavobacteriaceae bacterium]